MQYLLLLLFFVFATIRFWGELGKYLILILAIDALLLFCTVYFFKNKNWRE